VAAKINWHRYGTKLRQCHPMSTCHCQSGRLEAQWQNNILPHTFFTTVYNFDVRVDSLWTSKGWPFYPVTAVDANATTSAMFIKIKLHFFYYWATSFIDAVRTQSLAEWQRCPCNIVQVVGGLQWCKGYTGVTANSDWKFDSRFQDCARLTS